MPVSPSTDNLWIGKGTCTFQATGETAARDLGEVEAVEFTPSIEKLDYLSNRSGVRKKVKTVIVEKGGSLRVVMGEITAKNLALAVAGSVSTNTAGQEQVEILANNSVEGVFTITGTNEIGQMVDAVFNKVSFSPEGSVNFISDEWGNLEVTGDVLADDNGAFGTLTLREQA